MAAAKPSTAIASVRAMTTKSGSCKSVAHGFELLHHLGGRHDTLVVVMAAFFGKGLILEMEGRDPGTFESARRRLRVERIAEAGIGIGDDRHINHVHHRGQPVDDAQSEMRPRSGTPAARAMAPPLA